MFRTEFFSTESVYAGIFSIRILYDGKNLSWELVPNHWVLDVWYGIGLPRNGFERKVFRTEKSRLEFIFPGNCCGMTFFSSISHYSIASKLSCKDRIAPRTILFLKLFSIEFHGFESV